MKKIPPSTFNVYNSISLSSHLLHYLITIFFYLLLPEFGCRVVVGGCCVGSSVLWSEKPNAKFAVYISYAQIHNSQINEWLGYGTCEIRNLGKGK